MEDTNTWATLLIHIWGTEQTSKIDQPPSPGTFSSFSLLGAFLQTPFRNHLSRILTLTLCSSPSFHAPWLVSTITYILMIQHLNLIQDHHLAELVSPLGCPITISILHKPKAELIFPSPKAPGEFGNYLRLSPVAGSLHHFSSLLIQ